MLSRFAGTASCCLKVLVLAALIPAAGKAQHRHDTAMTMPDSATIARTVGHTGTYIAAENVYKIAVPRTDVAVTVDAAPMPPFMGLTSWVAFHPGHTANSLMLMGDLVLFEDEVNPVMSALFEHGLEVTALHNHFFYAKPMVFFMHVGGDGDASTLARGVRAALDTIYAIRTKRPEPASGFDHPALASKSSLDSKEFEEVFHTTPAESNGMVKVVVGRTATMDGHTVGKEMGVNSWAAFMGTDSLAEVDGDIVTEQGELQPVLRSLRKDGINVVAIHNHMDDEAPRYIFLHYWGIGNARQLAKSVESAFEKLGVQRHAKM